MNRDYTQLIERMTTPSGAPAGHAAAPSKVFLERQEVVTDMRGRGVSDEEIKTKFPNSGQIICAERTGSDQAGNGSSF